MVASVEDSCCGPTAGVRNSSLFMNVVFLAAVMLCQNFLFSSVANITLCWWIGRWLTSVSWLAYLLCRKLQSRSCCRRGVVWYARQPAFQTFTMWDDCALLSYQIIIEWTCSVSHHFIYCFLYRDISVSEKSAYKHSRSCGLL